MLLLLDPDEAPVPTASDGMNHAGPGRSGLRRLQSIAAIIAGGKREAAMNFRTACEVGDALAARLGLDPLVRASLAANFERWNGRGLPAGTRGDNIPVPMRIAQVAQELKVLARINGIDNAVDTIRKRRGKAYDPDLADLTAEHAPRWWTEIETADPWDAALAVAPHDRPLDPASVHAALLVVADFADHSTAIQILHEGDRLVRHRVVVKRLSCIAGTTVSPSIKGSYPIRCVQVTTDRI